MAEPAYLVLRRSQRREWESYNVGLLRWTSRHVGEERNHKGSFKSWRCYQGRRVSGQRWLQQWLGRQRHVRRRPQGFCRLCGGRCAARITSTLRIWLEPQRHKDTKADRLEVTKLTLTTNRSAFVSLWFL